MSSSGEPVSFGADGEDAAIGVTAQRPVAVYSCSRLGRVANPPGFSLASWLRSGRLR